MGNSKTRRFHIGDVLSVTTGCLVSPRGMDGIYDLLNWMTGDDLMTHQIPRAVDECGPRILEQFPELVDVHLPPGVAGEHPVRRWVEAQADRFGAYRDVAPLHPDDHTRIHPLTELALMAPHMRVVAVDVPDPDGGVTGADS